MELAVLLDDSDEQLSAADNERELRNAAPGVVFFFGMIGEGAGGIMLRSALAEGATFGLLGSAVAVLVGSTWALKKSTIG